RLRSAPAKNEERQQAIEQMFRDAGCPAGQLEVRPMKHSKFGNVVCTIPGERTATTRAGVVRDQGLETQKIILVGGHFDHVRTGDGIIDNWSGVSMVANVLQAMVVTGRRHTLQFVAFAREEEGLLGSRAFTSQLSKADAAGYAAMVNIDSL